jgi:hypothetical protein
MDSSLISSIYKSRKTLIELMKNQNYNVDEYEYFSINEINIKYQNKQLDMLLEKNTENNKTKIYIRYYFGKSLRSQIQDIIDDLFNLSEILTKNDTLLIIIKENINDILMQDLKHIWEQDGIFIIVQNIASRSLLAIGCCCNCDAFLGCRTSRCNQRYLCEPLPCQHRFFFEPAPA